jgi:hypothetical protein
MTETKDTCSMEDQVLKESIVSAVGLNSDQLQIGLKGDPSIRESASLRKRYRSSIDDAIDQIVVNLEDMMLNRGIYRIFVGFNSGEIRTLSVFDPLRSEIHDGAKLADRDYLERQFPPLPFEDKISLMRELYRALRATDSYQGLPGYWKNILQRRSDNWKPLSREDIHAVFSSLKVLREIQAYYLRNITICMVQGTVRMQFNCDGTQIINAKDLQKFLHENLP